MHNESVDVADNEGEEFEEPVAAEEEDEAQCDGDEEEYAREDFLSLSIEELLDVDVFKVQLRGSRIHPRKTQQVVDHSNHPVSFALNDI